MKALVLGGSGFIGSHVVDALLNDGHEVRVYDRYPERYRSNLHNVEFVQGDISDTTCLSQAMDEMDVVFHLVSTTVPTTANLDPVADITGNLIATVELLNTMRRQGVGRLVYLSSGGTVYGVPEEIPVPETHPLRPISSYGIVKVAIENYILMEEKLHGLKSVILRPSNPYGPRQGHGGIQGVIGTYMWCVARGEPMQLWGDGKIVRDFIHIQDVARLCARCAKSNATGVFNVGQGKGYSIIQILQAISKTVGHELEPEIKTGRKFDVPRVVLDINAAKDVFDWEPQIDLQDGLKDTWQWIREQNQ